MNSQQGSKPRSTFTMLPPRSIREPAHHAGSHKRWWHYPLQKKPASNEEYQIQPSPLNEYSNFAATSKLKSDILDFLSKADKIYHKKSRIFYFLGGILFLIFACFLPSCIAMINSSSYFEISGFIVEIVLFALLALFDFYLAFYELRMKSNELFDKIKTLLLKVNSCQYDQIMSLARPSTDALSIVKIVRDGWIYHFPASLIVKGDIIELYPGERSPCKAERIDFNTGNETGAIIEMGMKFIPSPSEFQNFPQRFYFRSKETPVLKAFSLMIKESGTVREVYLERLHDKFIYISLFILAPLFLCSITIYSTIFGFVFNYNSSSSQWIVSICYPIGLITISLLSSTCNVYGVINRLYANARISVLYNVLKYNSTPFINLQRASSSETKDSSTPINEGEDIAMTSKHESKTSEFSFQMDSSLPISDSDILSGHDDSSSDSEGSLSEEDQFDDEAPPPTKDLSLSEKTIIRRMIEIYFGRSKYLVYHKNLVDSLGNISILSYLDREGSLSKCFSALCEVNFPSSELKLTNLVIDEGIFTPGYFEDEEWAIYIQNLKPIGLAAYLVSNCVQKFSKEPHTSFPRSLLYGRVPAVQQTCPCPFAKAVGFSDSVLHHYKTEFDWSIEFPLTENLNWNDSYVDEWIPMVETKLIKHSGNGVSNSTSKSYIFSGGSCKGIIQLSTDYWDGSKIHAIDEDMRKKLSDEYDNAILNDSQIISYSFKPILKDSQIPPSLLNNHRINFNSKSIPKSWKEFFGNQIYLGFLQSYFCPKREVPEFVEDLSVAGIRFVYFSPYHEGPSKAFAECLGLETDWNSSIMLSSPEEDEHTTTATNHPTSSQLSEISTSSGYSCQSDIKARLPRGIKQIKTHLKQVDDIPLHVSLFTECKRTGNGRIEKEMIQIFKEEHEVVGTVGSCIRFDSISGGFSAANVAICIDEPLVQALPSVVVSPGSSGGSQIDSMSLFELGLKLMAIPSSFRIPRNSSPYVITELIREARTLTHNLHQSFNFSSQASVAIALAFAINHFALLPPLLWGYQLFILLFVVVPLISSSLIGAPHDPNVMSLHPFKNPDRLPSKINLISWFLLKWFPFILAVPIIYFTCLNSLVLEYNSDKSLYRLISQSHWSDASPAFSELILVSQTIAFFSTSFYLCVFSSVFVHCVLPIYKTVPFVVHSWSMYNFVAFVASLMFSSLFLLISWIVDDVDYFQLLKSIQWYVWTIIFIWPAFGILWIEFAIKPLERAQFERFQKRSKLEFNTKLGMHSPV